MHGWTSQMIAREAGEPWISYPVLMLHWADGQQEQVIIRSDAPLPDEIEINEALEALGIGPYVRVISSIDHQARELSIHARHKFRLAQNGSSLVYVETR